MLGTASTSAALALLVCPLPQGTVRAATEPSALGALDVPLARLAGVPTFRSAGVAFLDYDGDGWIDFYVNSNAGLWRNEGGVTFTRVADLDVFLPPLAMRDGAHAADYDADGLPDIACSPRGDCLYVLRNVDGAGTFAEIATDPALLIDPPGCALFGETFCWGDVDDDGDLDLWATAYPDPLDPASDGNQFLENLGPTGPLGAHRFERRTQASGLWIPSNVSRPEGAQLADADRDGDLDGYSNGVLYQNVTADGGPAFRHLVRTATGIQLAARLDEGALFFDYDLDGDQDLFVLYKGFGNRIWENEGDGTFFHAEGVIEAPSEGSTEGCSAEDWDLDGDLDLTTGHIFRRNLLVEDGQAFLRLATHAIPQTFLNFPLPAWGDWDRDGDVDCAYANFNGPGALFRNETYGPGTPALEKVALRVLPLADSPLVARGLETEFGATVEVRVHGDRSGHVRRRFTATSHGYLQQSEYALTFALPPGPDPAAPAAGVVLDLAVDFPSRSDRGILRVDRTVNPALGGLALADLAEREVRVFRSGRVRIDGVDFAPEERFEHRLRSTGALVLPAPGTPPPEPVPAPAAGWHVGLELATPEAPRAILLAELVLDGQLAPSGPARCDANVQLWDVTAGEPARLVQTAALATSERNDRSFFPLDWLLKPARTYRIVCHVTELRGSPWAAAAAAPLGVAGGLTFARADPCGADALAAAPLLAGEAFRELRYRVGSGAAPAGHASLR
jgi:hypothetical protein